MNLPILSQRRRGEHQPHVVIPRIPILGNLSFSTKLILLMVAPLAMTLAVTLPLTFTGLNRLASVVATDRLAEEITIIEQQFRQFEDSLVDLADEIAVDPILLKAVREGDDPAIVSNLLATRIRSGVQHLEVVGIDGVRLGYEHQHDADYLSEAMDQLHTQGMSDLSIVRVIPDSKGWMLTAVRPLKDSEGLIGAITVGELIDSDTLVGFNFERSDPLVMMFNEAGEVVASSRHAPDDSKLIPITPDSKMVAMANSGQVSLGTAELGETKQRTAYAPVMLGGTNQGIFGVALTTSPIVGLRDELVANHILVTAALVLLVLGVGYVVIRTITRRILRMRDGAIEIGNGNMAVRIEEDDNDEIGTLAGEFNRMADNLNDKNAQLEQANRNLEMRVFERTEALEQANAQLLEAQSQLVRTEKMAVIGELSAGVAHDLRNPLGAIRNGVFFLKSRLVKSDKLTTETRVAESLSIMDDCITQCDKIIGDLLFFTRISAPTYSAVTIRGVLESAVWGMGTPDGISVVKELGDEDVSLEADHDQLVRVFSNLAVNAQEAMADGGVLTIRVKSEGPMVEVAFCDTGPGVPSSVLERIFDPLYTTKIQGTGLGLAVCQQIVAKHNGMLDVHSEEGVGTTFTVRLPLKSGDMVDDSNS